MGIFRFIIYVIFCFVVASAAKKRGRSSVGYFILSIIISPLLGIIIVLILGETEESRSSKEVKELRKSKIINANLNIPSNGERDNARIKTPNENFSYSNSNENGQLLTIGGLSQWKKGKNVRFFTKHTFYFLQSKSKFIPYLLTLKNSVKKLDKTVFF